MVAPEVDEVVSVDAGMLAELHSLLDHVEEGPHGRGLSDDRLRALDRARRHRELHHVTCFAARNAAGSLVGWAQIDGADGGRTPSLEVAARLDAGPAVDRLLDAALGAHAGGGGGPLRWWVGHASPADDARAEGRGFSVERELLQLRCPLPLPASSPAGAPTEPVATRAFRPGLDEEAWLAQNNRAFTDHPEQGRWDLPMLLERESEPWFDPDGFRVLEVDGRIAGSCWTKVHAGSVPPLGEIYVIGVDPDFHGRGWGRALATDGLAWLATHGLRHGMLYVDAANRAALGLYTSMGMTTDHVDRAYLRASS